MPDMGRMSANLQRVEVPVQISGEAVIAGAQPDFRAEVAWHGESPAP